MTVRIELRSVGRTNDTPAQSLAVDAQNTLSLLTCGQPIRNWTDSAGVRWNARRVATSDPVTCEKGVAGAGWESDLIATRPLVRQGRYRVG